MNGYFTTKWFLFQAVITVFIVAISTFLIVFVKEKAEQKLVSPEYSYWFVLERKSQREHFYLGVPGDKAKSSLIRTFRVKSGIAGERPTPLPQLLNREYWLITAEFETKESPETAPYFLALDIPFSDEFPYGPTPYLECNGQCDWILPGSFGLHGVNGDPTRLSDQNPGSSGCIRHSDADITYLYNLLDPQKEEIRYYIEDI